MNNSAPDRSAKDSFAQRFQEALRLRDAREYEAALTILQALRKEKPASAAVVGILGDVYWQQGQLDRAVSCFKRATKLSPASELASLGLFHTLWESGQIDDAKREMARFMAKAPSEEYAVIAAEINGKDNLRRLAKAIDDCLKLADEVSPKQRGTVVKHLRAARHQVKGRRVRRTG